MSAEVRAICVRRGALWFGLIGGAAAWTVHLMSAYAVAEFGCVGRLDEIAFLRVSAIAWMELVLTLATALTAGAATVVAIRNHRRLSDDARGDAVAERYTAWVGVLTSGMFTFIILFESIPILYYLHSC